MALFRVLFFYIQVWPRNSLFKLVFCFCILLFLSHFLLTLPHNLYWNFCIAGDGKRKRVDFFPFQGKIWIFQLYFLWEEGTVCFFRLNSLQSIFDVTFKTFTLVLSMLIWNVSFKGGQICCWLCLMISFHSLGIELTMPSNLKN